MDHWHTKSYLQAKAIAAILVVGACQPAAPFQTRKTLVRTDDAAHEPRTTDLYVPVVLKLDENERDDFHRH